MDFFIGLIVGVFAGGTLGFFITALMIANGREVEFEPEPDGVDEVLDELFQKVQEQPTPHRSEERQEELDWKFRE